MCKNKIDSLCVINEEQAINLYYSACAFRNNALLMIKYPNILGSESLTYSPIIVNGFLAIELYLKYLKAYECFQKKEPISFYKVHNLKLLFKDLSDELRKEIIESIKQCNYDEEYMKKFLKKHCNDFVEHRYLVKNKNYSNDVSFVIKLNKSLYDISHRIVNSRKMKINNNSFSYEYDKGLEEIVSSEMFRVGGKII